MKKRRSHTYGQRVEFCTNPTAKKLLAIMEEKKSNLSVAADVTSCQKLLELTDAIGPNICLLKTHIDILDDFTPDVTFQLRLLSKKHHF